MARMENNAKRMPVTPDVSRRASAYSERLPWPSRVVGLVILSSSLLLTMSGLTAWNLRSQRVSVDWLVHTEQVRSQLSRVLQILVDAQAGARVYVLTGEASILRSYRDATEALRPEVDRLEQLVSKNPGQRSLAAQLGEKARELMAQNEALLRMAREGNSILERDAAAGVPAQNLITETRVITEARALLFEMQSREAQLLELRRAAVERARRDSAIALWATGNLGVLLIILVVYSTRRDQALMRRAERELATTLRSIADAVIATDTKGSVRFMNPIAERLTGWTESRARGQSLANVFRVITEETRVPVDSRAKHMSQEGGTGQPANHRILLARDGTERAIADSSAPIVNESGRAQGMVLVFRDVSEARAAERALQLRDAELQIIHDYARFPIAHCDPEHRYLFVNRSYAERLGLTPEQCVGKHIRDVAGERAYEIIRPHIEEALGGRTIEFETEICYPGELGTRWVRCIYAPVQDANGTVRSFVAAITDITDKKRAEAALRDANRRKDEFLATLSHELRNPLAPIRTAARLLASPELGPHQLQWAQNVIQRQVRHMALLLDDLLDMTRVTQGKLELKKELVTLNSVIDAAVEAAHPLIHGKSHHLTVTLPPEPITIDADPLRLSQVLSNLLTNAAKYTDPGGHIELSVVRQNGILALSVKDDGIGISPGSRDRIFEMFSQVEDITGRSAGGLGIGLALVKGITELHGGTIDVKSDGLGRGSEFILHLSTAAPESAAQSRFAANASI